MNRSSQTQRPRGGQDKTGYVLAASDLALEAQAAFMDLRSKLEEASTLIYAEVKQLVDTAGRSLKELQLVLSNQRRQVLRFA